CARDMLGLTFDLW
nr:immunoglobulin heavy chain junction region [Macaca mulatta]